MTKFLTKENILNIDDLIVKELYVKEWDASVRIRALSSKERDMFEKSLFKGNDLKNPQVSLENFRARFVALVLVDERGKRMFNTSDIDKLGEKSSSAMDFIFAEGQKLSGITKQDVKDMTKN